MSDDISLVVFFADCHINSVVGLCPPYLTLDAGGSYRPSSAQRKVWNRWLHFWDIIEAKKKEHRATLYVLSVGDAGDRNTHDGAGLISRAEADEVRFVTEAFQRPAELADYFFMIRGTAAHTGPRAAIEELAAKDLGCVKDEESGTYSWWWLPLKAGGVSFDVTHHPRTAGHLPHTVGSAAARHADIIRREYLEEGRFVPDVALRAHIHKYQPGPAEPKPLFFFLPPWQLTPSFGHRLGAGGTIRPIGGLWFLCQDGKFEWGSEIYKQKRRGQWESTS